MSLRISLFSPSNTQYFTITEENRHAVRQRDGIPPITKLLGSQTPIIQTLACHAIANLSLQGMAANLTIFQAPVVAMLFMPISHNSNNKGKTLLSLTLALTYQLRTERRYAIQGPQFLHWSLFWPHAMSRSKKRPFQLLPTYASMTVPLPLISIFSPLVGRPRSIAGRPCWTHTNCPLPLFLLLLFVYV